MAKSVPVRKKDKGDDFTEKEGEYWQKLTEGRVLDLDVFTACAIGDFECVKGHLLHNSESNIVNKKNSGGWTPLMYACYVGHEKILELLISEQADIRAKGGKHGITSLMVASSSGNTSVVEHLVKKGADVNVVDKKGQTALFHATKQGHLNVVRFFLECNADVLISQYGTGYTPFMEAARQGHEYVFNVFLEHGIDLHHVCDSGLTARDLAYQNDAVVISNMIDNHLKPLSSLRDEPELGDKVHRWLHDHNHDIAVDDMNEFKPPSDKQSHPVSIRCGFRRNSASDTYGQSYETIVDSDRTPVGTPVETMFQQYPAFVNTIGEHYGRYFNNTLPSLQSFLQELHLEKYQKIFDEESVDFRVLISLTEDEFRELAIKLGPRRKLQSAIAKWKQETGRSGGSQSKELDSLKRQLAEVVKALERVQEARSSLEAEQMEERARRNHIYFIGEKVQRSCQELRNYNKNLRERIETLETSALATSDKNDLELHSKLKTLHKQMMNDIQNTDSVVDVILRRVKKILSDDLTELSSDSDSPESSCTSISKSEVSHTS